MRHSFSFLLVVLLFSVSLKIKAENCLQEASRIIDSQTLRHKLMENEGLKFSAVNGSGHTRKFENGEEIFLNTRGSLVTEARTIERYKNLRIPPAWQEVWISPNPKGHIQAIGTDQAGRKQYLYHPLWENVRAGLKRKKLQDFGTGLKKLRISIQKDLNQPAMTQENVIGTLLAIMDKTYIRIGSPQYENYGLSTLLKSHVRIEGNKITIEFVGKSGVEHRKVLTNQRLANNLRKILEMPGDSLFQYKNSVGEIQPLSALEINQYIKERGQQDISAKNFRTWHATRLAINFLLSGKETGTEYSRLYEFVAQELGNTPNVARTSYVDPIVIKVHENNNGLQRIKESLVDSRGDVLNPEEKILNAILSDL